MIEAPSSSTKAIFDDTSYDEDWAAEIEEEYQDKKAKRADMIGKMTLSLSQKLNKDEEVEEVETETPTDLDPFFEE